jgi:hypothetical protein
MTAQRGEKGLLFLAAGCSAFVNPAPALEPSDLLSYSIGPLILRPQLGVSERFDSNIYFQQRDETADLITVISPGLNLFVGKADRNFLALDYVMDAQFYLDNDQINTVNHLLAFRDRLERARLTVKGDDSVQWISGILSGSLIFSRTTPVDRTVQYHHYTVSYSVTEKTSIYLDGLYSGVDYQSDIPLYDSETIRGTAGFAFKRSEKTSFFGELYYGQTSVNPNSSSLADSPRLTYAGGFVGARGEFTSKLRGTIKAGYERREFTNNQGSDGAPVVEAALDYRVREKTLLSLTYQRASGTSVDTAGTSYVSDTAGFRVTQAFGTKAKWLATFAAQYAGYDYGVANRQDRLYNFNLGMAYRLQIWLTAGLNYEFEKFESNLPVLQDYNVHRITARIAVGY